MIDYRAEKAREHSKLGRNAQVRGESKCKGLVGVLGVFEERQSRENGGE